VDVGTGGGYKLMKYFSDVRTLGLDLEPNVSWLKDKMPDREWAEVPLSESAPGFDLLICADVIEHLVDPDELLGFIERSKPKFAIVSTPNRDNLLECFAAGPPRNTCHVREWSSAEFAEYLGQRFEILSHTYPDPARRDVSTMWVIMKCR
jgi:2-polyprenyl-3-methyl-5-hydroxy-6-metoxy-1,4-benzoquinol methylase